MAKVIEQSPSEHTAAIAELQHKLQVMHKRYRKLKALAEEEASRAAKERAKLTAAEHRVEALSTGLRQLQNEVRGNVSKLG
jgi:predicted  nucleic acid-binding Zn-ribbon protein